MRGGVCRLLRLREEADQLAGGHSAVEGPPRLIGDAQRLLGGTQLRLAKARRGDLGARRQGRERNDVGNDPPFDLELGGA